MGFESSSMNEKKDRHSSYRRKHKVSQDGFIRSVFTLVGTSAVLSSAQCNEEASSQSLLMLDGIQTISLGRYLTSSNSASLQHVHGREDALEHWGDHLICNLSVGRVIYDYGVDSAVDACNTSPAHQSLHRWMYVSDEEILYLSPKFRHIINCLKVKKYSTVKKLCEESLSKDRERYGLSDLVCAIDLHNLGVANFLSGDIEAAKICFEDAAGIKRRCLGGKAVVLTDSLIEIGILMFLANDLRSALDKFHEAQTICDYSALSTKSTDSIVSSKILNNIGCICSASSKYIEALEYFHEAYAIQRSCLGSENSPLASILNCALILGNIGYVKLKLDSSDCLLEFDESLLLLESVLGDASPTVVALRQNIEYAEERFCKCLE